MLWPLATKDELSNIIKLNELTLGLDEHFDAAIQFGLLEKGTTKQLRPLDQGRLV